MSESCISFSAKQLKTLQLRSSQNSCSNGVMPVRSIGVSTVSFDGWTHQMDRPSLISSSSNFSRVDPNAFMSVSPSISHICQTPLDLSFPLLYVSLSFANDTGDVIVAVHFQWVERFGCNVYAKATSAAQGYHPNVSCLC